MKSIDWKEVASNAALSKQFSVAVYNRFEALSANSDLQLNNIEEVYSNLISATESVAKDMLPKKLRGKQSRYADYPSVKLARNNLKTVSFEYHQNPSKNKRKHWSWPKRTLTSHI